MGAAIRYVLAARDPAGQAPVLCTVETPDGRGAVVAFTRAKSARRYVRARPDRAGWRVVRVPRALMAALLLHYLLRETPLVLVDPGAGVGAGRAIGIAGLLAGAWAAAPVADAYGE